MSATRKSLVFAMAGLLLVGLVLLALSLLTSLLPSATAGRTLPRLDASLAPGSFRSYTRGSSEFLVLRTRQGDLRVYVLRRSREGIGGVVMPDSRSFGWSGLCARVEPEMSAGHLADSAEIRCVEPLIADAQSPDNWRWTLDGKNLGSGTADLRSPRFMLEGTDIVVDRW